MADVKRVGDLIADISRSSSQQSAELAEVSSAVGQLDVVTQQNAAMVEQSAASAESLRQHATGLTEIVAQFSVAPA